MEQSFILLKGARQTLAKSGFRTKIGRWYLGQQGAYAEGAPQGEGHEDTSPAQTDRRVYHDTTAASHPGMGVAGDGAGR